MNQFNLLIEMLDKYNCTTASDAKEIRELCGILHTQNPL